jgi:hypothetical protein
MGINERTGTSQNVTECHPRCSSGQTGAEGAESHKKEKRERFTCRQNRHRHQHLEQLLSEALAAGGCPQTLSPTLVEELKHTAPASKFLPDGLH